MDIKIKSDILKDLKERLAKQEKTAARFVLVSFGWSGPILDIVLDEQNENDAVAEIEGVKFVADNKIAFLVKNPEVIKNGNEFTVKKTGSCS